MKHNELKQKMPKNALNFFGDVSSVWRESKCWKFTKMHLQNFLQLTSTSMAEIQSPKTTQILHLSIKLPIKHVFRLPNTYQLPTS